MIKTVKTFSGERRKTILSICGLYDIEDRLLRDVCIREYQKRFEDLTVYILCNMLEDNNIQYAMDYNLIEYCYETLDYTTIYTKNLIFAFENDILISIQTREDIREEMLEKYGLMVELDNEDVTSIAYFDNRKEIEDDFPVFPYEDDLEEYLDELTADSELFYEFEDEILELFDDYED